MRNLVLYTGIAIWVWLGVSLLLLLHEMAHAAVAALAGCRVDHLQIGIGPSLFKIQLGSWPIAFSLIPACAWIEYSKEQELSLAQDLAVKLAGPVANIFFGIALFLFVDLFVGFFEFWPAFWRHSNFLMSLVKGLQKPGRAGLWHSTLALATGSLWIGIINLLPLWPLDGGQMLDSLVRPWRWWPQRAYRWCGATLVIVSETGSWLLIIFSR